MQDHHKMEVVRDTQRRILVARRSRRQQTNDPAKPAPNFFSFKGTYYDLRYDSA